jgi:hypothetical protein
MEAAVKTYRSWDWHPTSLLTMTNFLPFYLVLIICLLTTTVEVCLRKKTYIYTVNFVIRTMLNIVQKHKKPCIVSEGIPRPHLGKRYVCSSRIFIVKTPNKVDIKTLGNWPVLPTQGYTVCRP